MLFSQSGVFSCGRREFPAAQDSVCWGVCISQEKIFFLGKFASGHFRGFAGFMINHMFLKNVLKQATFWHRI